MANTPSAYNVPKGTMLLASQQTVVTVTEIVFFALLLRALPLAQIGQFSLLAAALGIFTTITQLALPTAATRFISKCIGDKDPSSASNVAHTSLRLLLYVSAPALLVGIVFSPFMAQAMFDDQTISMLILGTFLTGFILDLTSLIGSYFLGLGHYSRIVYQNILYVPLSRGLGLILATWLGLEGVVVGWIIGALATLALSLKLWKGSLPNPTSLSTYPSRTLLGFSLPVFVSALVGLGQGWGDIALLQAILGQLDTTGAYFLAITTAGFLQLMWVPLATALAPALSACYATAGAEAVSKKLSRAFRLVNTIVIPLSAIMVVLAPTVLGALYGPALGGQGLNLSLLAFTMIFSAHALLLVTGLHAVGNTKPLIRITIIATLVDLVLVASTANYLGSTAGVLGRMLMPILTLILTYNALRKTVFLDFGNGLYQAVILAAAISLPIAVLDLALTQGLHLAPLARILLFIPIAGISFLGVSRRLTVLTAPDICLVKEALPVKLRFLVDGFQRPAVNQIAAHAPAPDASI